MKLERVGEEERKKERRRKQNREEGGGRKVGIKKSNLVRAGDENERGWREGRMCVRNRMHM